MKRLLQLLLLGLLASAQAQEEAATEHLNSSISSLVGGTAGWSFSPLRKAVVSQLGCFDEVISLQGPVQVGLWSSNGQLLASVSISSASSRLNQSRFEAISPVFLQAGQTYLLGLHPLEGSAGLSVFIPGIEEGGALALSEFLQLGGSAQSETNFSFPSIQTNGLGAAFLGANLLFWAAPRIDFSPTNQSVVAGGTARFEVSVSGTRPLSYQWLFQGTNLAGATANPLLLNGVQPAQAGAYSVEVSNLAGSATSAVATLSLQAAPLLAQLKLSPSNAVVSFPSVTGTLYTLEYKESLSLAQWTGLAPAAAGTGGLLFLTNWAPLPSTRFYRVRAN